MKICILFIYLYLNFITNFTVFIRSYTKITSKKNINIGLYFLLKLKGTTQSKYRNRDTFYKMIHRHDNDMALIMYLFFYKTNF